MSDSRIAVTKKIDIELILGERCFFVKVLFKAQRNAVNTAKKLMLLKLYGSGLITISAPINATIARNITSLFNISFRDVLANIRMNIGVMHEIAIQLTADTFDKA